jgi:hypothetical protein
MPAPRPGPSRQPPKPQLRKDGSKPTSAVSQVGSNRKVKTLVYALGVAAVVWAGTFTGAILKTDQQLEGAKRVGAVLNPLYYMSYALIVHHRCITFVSSLSFVLIRSKALSVTGP